ncbi:unnamed protein product [Chondrus crispus]|uniref:Uncharacterized protein n=1 Tax=Chondrus crispus TaxID=2769 RepID=R7QTZ0_CHOCR|nr:unnamed protein product [Chondrus crispus]CDF41178.1 unnamed protein product [Chondrus crispus]|eukprot:XP_005711472.1 unnamed protein product [Chondrus crispus]
MNCVSDGGCRGHRSCFRCSHCDLRLCVRTYARFRRSCWDVWHSNKRLEPRQESRSSRSRSPSSQGGTSCLTTLTVVRTRRRRRPVDSKDRSARLRARTS